MDLYNWLIILYVVLFLGLSIWKLKWAVLAVVGFLPMYLIRFQVGQLPMTLLEVMILIVFIVWAVKNVRKIKEMGRMVIAVFGVWMIRGFRVSGYKKFTNYKLQITNYKQIPNLKIQNSKLFFISTIVFLIAAIVAMFMGPDLRIAAGIWKAYFVEPILFLIVFVNVIKKDDIKKIFYIFSGTVLVLSVVAIYQKMTGNFITNEFWAAAATRRVTSVFGYPNALALYLAPVVVILIGCLAAQITNYKLQITKKIKNQKLKILYKLFYLIAVVSGLLTVYFTKSKGAMLGILTGIIFYALFYKEARKYFLGILGTVGILTVSYFGMAGNTFDWRGEATVAGGDSITTRIEMWSETWQMLKTKPILGAGLMGYQSAIAPWHKKDYIEIYLYPHNLFLNFWTEIGIMGLMGFLGIVGWFYIVGFRGRKQLSNRTVEQGDSLFNYSIVQLLMAGMTALLIHGLVDVPYFKNDLSILFWVLIGMMIILNKKTGEISENNV